LDDPGGIFAHARKIFAFGLSPERNLSLLALSRRVISGLGDDAHDNAIATPTIDEKTTRTPLPDGS
jgi:hypothetical protein